MLSLMRGVILGLAVMYLLAAGVLFVLQRQFQYFPTHNNPDPAALGLTGVRVENLETPDGQTLVLWYTPAPEGRPTILFFQGNAGEIADRADRLTAYQSAGLGAAFLSLRGYGGSSGHPTEAGLVADAMTAYDWLISQGVVAENIVIVGESLGTGIAVQLAGARQAGALVLGAPYASAVEIAAGQFFWLPVGFLMKDQFRSIDHFGSVTIPTLILHGTDDQVIPFASGQRLRAAGSQPIEFVVLEGAGHDALFYPETWSREIAFIERIFAR